MSTEPSSFQIQKILDETIIEHKPHYLIKWKGYSSTQSTWEPIESLIDTLDIVHDWKVKNNPQFMQRLSSENSQQHSKQIMDENNSLQCKNKKYQSKSGSGKKTNRRKKYLQIDQQQILSIQSSNQEDVPNYVEEFSFDNEQKIARKTRSKSNKKKDMAEDRKNNTQTRSINNNKSDVNGFKIIGKVTKEGVQSILWCFDWDGKKICQVQLKDGRKVNMRREDVKKICPDKLLEYYDKLEKSKI